MKKFNILQFDLGQFSKIEHSFFGLGKIKRIFMKKIGGIQIPFAIIEYKEFEFLYVLGDWEEFYSSYDSIKVNFSINRKLKHYKYGDGIIESVEFKEGIKYPYITINFGAVSKVFTPPEITSEYFDIETPPIFDNTFKEACYIYNESQLAIFDSRCHSKVPSSQPAFYLYRVAVGCGYRTRNSLSYIINDNEITINIDKECNKSPSSGYFDLYPGPKYEHVQDGKGPNLMGAGDYIWNNQQRYKDFYWKDQYNDYEEYLYNRWNSRK